MNNKDTRLIYEAYQTQVDINALIQEMNEAYRQDLINEGIWSSIKSGSQAIGSKLGGFNKKIHEIAKKTQGTAPVQNFDQKINGYIQQLASKFEPEDKTYKTIQWMAGFAKKNPGWTNFIVAVLGFIVGGMVGGILPVMAVTGILRIAAGLLKGEKASTAVGKAAVVGTAGALAGAAIGGIIDIIGDAVAAGGDALGDIGLHFDDIPGTTVGHVDVSYESYGHGNDGRWQWEGFTDQAMKDDLGASGGTNYSDMLAKWEQAGKLTDEYQAKLGEVVKDQVADAKWTAKAKGIVSKIGKAVGALGAGAAAVKAGDPK